jgi:hypothetical protein
LRLDYVFVWTGASFFQSARKAAVRHITTYQYKQPVSFGEHRMMLRPRESHDQRLLESTAVLYPAIRALAGRRPSAATLPPTSTSGLIRGLPGLRRAFEPSNLRATSLRYQPKMVSGRATLATLAENPAAQSMADLGERGSLGVREFQPPFQLGFQDAIFGGQIFIPRQQLLVHHPCNEGQDALIAPKNRSQRRPVRLFRESTIHRLFYSFNFLTIRSSRCATRTNSGPKHSLCARL